ncbi:MAG: hypothetical protein NT062_19205 [Proteobacteria bacterium]|nr:hypothetical protein [Pseudomonadota bacterium]
MRHCLVLALALVNACARSTLAYDDLEPAMRAATCARLARCGAFPDGDACEAYFRPRPDADLAAAVATGATRYDGELAQLCVDALADQACDATLREVRRAPQACTRMLVGTRAPANPCEFDRECSSGVCAPTATCTPGQCCPGTCAAPAPRAAIGETCADTTDCADDTYCTTEHVCAALESAGGPCFVDSNCAYGLACDNDTFPGACVVAAATGAPCPDDRCAELGARCIAGTCTLAPLGAACVAARDCTEFARCADVTHTCVATPSLGMSCSGPCAGEAYCDHATNRTCQPPLDDMQPCFGDNECTSRYCAEGPVFDACTPLPVCS